MRNIILGFLLLFSACVPAQIILTKGRIDTIWSTGQVPKGTNFTNSNYTWYPNTYVAGSGISIIGTAKTHTISAVGYPVIITGTSNCTVTTGSVNTFTVNVPYQTLSISSYSLTISGTGGNSINLPSVVSSISGTTSYVPYWNTTTSFSVSPISTDGVNITVAGGQSIFKGTSIQQAMFFANGNVRIGNNATDYGITWNAGTTRAGINIDAPTNLFEINGTSINSGLVLNTDANHFIGLEFNQSNVFKGAVIRDMPNNFFHIETPDNFYAIKIMDNHNVLICSDTLVSGGLVGIGTSTILVSAKLHVVGTGSTSATYNLKVSNQNGTLLFSGQDDGTVAILGNTGQSVIAGNVGETQTSTISTYTNYANSGAYQTITSLTLTAGNWDVSAFGTISAAGSTVTTSTNAIFVVSTTASSEAGATEGLNIAYIDENFVGTSKQSTHFNFFVNNNSTTTYYLNSQATFSLGNPQYVGTIQAVRIR